MRNCTKLRNENNQNKIRKVFITPDITPKEREKDKALQAELSKRNTASGNSRYMIKNGRIVQRECAREPPPKPVRHTNPITDNVNKQAQIQCYNTMFNCYQVNAEYKKTSFMSFKHKLRVLNPRL